MTSDEVHHDKVLSRALATSATRICITPTFQAVSQRLPSEGLTLMAECCAACCGGEQMCHEFLINSTIGRLASLNLG
jgi:hypothetical protein